MALDFDVKAHASLQPPKPQAQCCSDCLNIPCSIRNHTYHSRSFLDPETLDASGWRYWFKPSIDALKQSAIDGCPLCALIYPRCLQSSHGDPHYWKHGNGDPRLEMGFRGTTPYSLDIRLGDWPVQNFKFTAAPHEWSERFARFFRRQSSPNLPKFWISECDHQHQTHCLSDSDFLPTRLVDLQHRQGNDDIVCVVHTVNANISDRRYMTLSHRWDHLTDEEAQLTVRNVDSRVEGFSLSSLPPSFRYAAFLTRELGIRYLWIDSLCILQDSREDWVRQSVQMGQVYSASYCTIATSNDALETYNNHCQQRNDSSLDVRERSKGREDEYAIWPHWVGSSLLGERRSHLPSNQYHVRIFDSEPWDWEETLDQTVLSGRGWTLQERQLSRRVIHVTSNSLLWECRTSRGSEQVPWTGKVTANMKIAARYRINDSIKDDRQIFEKDSPRYFYNLWYEIIWNYSNRLLSEESDKLPGLAGLAKTLANMTGDEYVAGLWKGDIVSGLLWKTRRWNMDEEYKGRQIPRCSIRPVPAGFAPSGTHGAIQHTRPSCWRAPSWSWASLDGQVRHRIDYPGAELDDSRFIPENIEIDTSSSRHADFRHLSLSDTVANRLTLTGFIQPCKTKYFLRDLFLGYLDSDFWTEGYKTLHEISDTSSPDLSSDELMEEAAVVGNWNGDKKLHSDQEQKDCIGVIQYDVVDDIVTNQTVYVLALRQLEREPSWQDDTPYCVPTERDERGRPTQQYQVFGLALVPTGEADNEYRRIGLAEFITPSWFKEDSKRTVTIV